MRIFKYLLIVIGLLFCSSDLISAKEGWFKVYIPINSNINNMDFYDDNFGLVSTAKNEIFVTLDGGKTFLEQTKEFKDTSKILDLYISKPNEIYISLTGKILLSIDTCKSWKSINNVYKNNLLSCYKLKVYEDACYCHTYNKSEFSTLYFSNNFIKWDSIQVLNYYESFYRRGGGILYYLNKNYYIKTSSETDKISNITNYGVILYKNNIELNIKSFTYSDFKNLKTPSFDLVDFYMISDTNILFTTSFGLFRTNNHFNSFSEEISWREGYSYNRISIRNNDNFYLYNSNRIYSYNYKNKKFKECIVQNLDNKSIDKVKSTSLNIAFAQLDINGGTSLNPINYFLKTEDGGGVDLSDVEEIVPQDEITQSTHIELYDILGRSITTFTSYGKLKAEIENYPRPHLIKWRDEKGIFHFEKMK